VRDGLLLRCCQAVDERGDREALVDIFVTHGVIDDITAYTPSRAVPHGWSEIEVGGATVVPGLINMHDHLGLAHPGTTEERAVAGESNEQRLLRMAGNASKALSVGVTGLRLMGEVGGLDVTLRDAIAADLIDGPRIWTAAQPLDYVRGGRGFVGAVECSSAEEYMQVASHQLERGADFLKLMMSGGGASDSPGVVHVSTDEFSAIRSVARGAGVRIAVHTAAVDHPIMDLLLEDGLDSLEHCYLISEELIDNCVSRGMLLVMTPLVSRSPEYLEAIGVPDEMISRMTETGKFHWNAVQAAVRAGAQIALGTDFHSHLRLDGTSAPVRELELYEEAGADPTRILAIASRNGATWLGVEDRLGLVEPGFDADLLVLDQNPMVKGAAAFRKIRHVISRGRVIELRDPESPSGAHE
jgi:imidazolonepropionase-like amidohydrolase